MPTMGAADRSNLFTLDSPGIPGAAELWLPSDLVAWCELDSCQHIMPVAPPEETPASSPRITSLTEPEPGSEPPLSPAAVEPPLPHHLAAVAGSSSSRPAAPRGASQPRAPQALPPPTEPHQEVEEMNQRFGGALSISAPTTAAGWGGASRRLGSPLQGPYGTPPLGRRGRTPSAPPTPPGGGSRHRGTPPFCGKLPSVPVSAASMDAVWAPSRSPWDVVPRVAAPAASAAPALGTSSGEEFCLLPPPAVPPRPCNECTWRLEEAFARRSTVRGVPGRCDQVLASLFIGLLEPHVQEADVMHHFLFPPPWPPGHPMTAYAGAVGRPAAWSMAMRSAPYALHSVKLVPETAGGAPRTYGFVRFASVCESQRALVEMQGTLLTPARMPWYKMRLHLGAVAGAWERRPTDAELAHLRTVCEREYVAQQREARAAQAAQAAQAAFAMHSGAPAATQVLMAGPMLEYIPTVLTFVASEEPGCSASRSTNAHDVPELATALMMAHTTSALDPTNTTVFVGSLFSAASEATLHLLFSPFGKILSTNIPRGGDCGFVQFSRKDEAARAIVHMQNYPFAGGTLRLSWGRNVNEKAAVRAATRAGLRWVEDAL